MNQAVVRFRPAHAQDSEDLFVWRNDSLTREGSLDTSLISRAAHEKWLRTSLRSPDRKIYIAEVDHAPIGVVRLDRRDREWELSWTIAPSARGKGLGKQMVRAATELSPGPLIAQVKESNEPSARIAVYAGFSRMKTVEGIILFKLGGPNLRRPDL